MKAPRRVTVVAVITWIIGVLEVTVGAIEIIAGQIGLGAVAAVLGVVGVVLALGLLGGNPVARIAMLVVLVANAASSIVTIVGSPYRWVAVPTLALALTSLVLLLTPVSNRFFRRG